MPKQLTRINPATKKPWTQLELVQAHLESLNSRISGFQDAINQIGKEWKPLVSSLVGELKTAEQRSALNQLQFLSGQLRGQLNSLGYTEIAKQIVTGYSDSVSYSIVAGDFAKMGPQPIHSVVAPDTLLHIRELDLQAFEQIGNNAIRTLAKQLTLDTMVGVPRNKMLAAMDAVLDGEFIGKANLYVDTATRLVDRTLTMKTWKEAGITTFLYSGPKDKKNRDFCSERVGKTFTLAEISKMNNGQSLPVLEFLGGWRCRHVLSPVQDPNNKYPEPTQRKQKTVDPQQVLFEAST
jgi:hypothetical protein